MALPLWIAFQASPNLKCWYSNKEQGWVQVGEILKVDNLIAPMVFSIQKDQIELIRKPFQMDGTHLFNFVLKRDDSTLLPVYEVGTPATKLMSVFGEFADAIDQLALALELSVVSFESTEQPGGFRLQASFPVCLNSGEVIRILGLLRAGIEILSYTRGFQMSELLWGDLPVDGSLFE